MTQLNRAYFTTNEEWYVYNVKKGILELTDKAPPKAVESYKEFYKNLTDSYGIEEEEIPKLED